MTADTRTPPHPAPPRRRWVAAAAMAAVTVAAVVVAVVTVLTHRGPQGASVQSVFNGRIVRVASDGYSACVQVDGSQQITCGVVYLRAGGTPHVGEHAAFAKVQVQVTHSESVVEFLLLRPLPNAG